MSESSSKKAGIDLLDDDATSSKSFHYCRIQESDMAILKMAKTILKKAHYEVFTEAVMEMIEERKKWKPEHKLDRYPWLASSANGERQTIALVESVAQEFEELIEEDDVRIADALYTALYFKTISMAHELNKVISDTLPEM